MRNVREMNKEFIQYITKKIAENLPNESEEETLDEALLSLYTRGLIDVKTCDDGEFAFTVSDDGAKFFSNEISIYAAEPAEA